MLVSTIKKNKTKQKVISRFNPFCRMARELLGGKNLHLDPKDGQEPVWRLSLAAREGRWPSRCTHLSFTPREGTGAVAAGKGREKSGRGQVYRVRFAKMFGVGFKVAKWERRSILTGERGSGRV